LHRSQYLGDRRSPRSRDPIVHPRPLHAVCAVTTIEAAVPHRLAQGKTHRHRVRLSRVRRARRSCRQKCNRKHGKPGHDNQRRYGARGDLQFFHGAVGAHSTPHLAAASWLHCACIKPAMQDSATPNKLIRHRPGPPGSDRACRAKRPRRMGPCGRGRRR